MMDHPPTQIKQSPHAQQHSHMRHASWASSVDNNPSPVQPRKRSADASMADGPVARKGRACLACRKLKVKCDSLDRGDAGCSRCQRLGIECITSKRLRMSLEDESGHPHPSLVRLEKAVEDVLSKLKMPALDSYIQAHASNPLDSVAQTTRENSREPHQVPVEHDIAGAPMEGLFEATQLSTLRARLKHGDPARRSSKKKMETDLVSQGVITLEEAEEMLQLFKHSLNRYLFDATISDDRTLQSVRESSTIFFTAIMVVASLHIPGKERIHLQCHKQLRELIASSMFDRFHTLEEIRALCIAAFWLPDLSWKLSGHCVRMATELNLHQAFYKAFYSQKQTLKDRKDARERARLWYLLYVLDHHFSIAYGRPPVTAELQAINETDVFLKSPDCTTSDRRVISQVSLFIILSRAYNVFGLEAERLMEGDDVTLLNHARFMEDVERWRHQFRHYLMIDNHVGDYPAIGVDLHYNFANLMLNSLALRGRSLQSLHTLPNSLRPLALRAIEAAHNILHIVLTEPDIQKSLVGVPLYLHSMIAFATVFLIKMSSRWAAIGVTISAETRTKPLVDGIISTMKNCRAGQNHILYSMAAGFERLLRRNFNTTNGGDASSGDANRSAAASMLQHDPNGRHYSAPSTTTSQQPFVQSPGTIPGSLQRTGSMYDGYGVSPSSGGTFSGWQTEDDMLWSMGMGYDLLANAPDVNSAGYGYGDSLYPSMP